MARQAKLAMSDLLIRDREIGYDLDHSDVADDDKADHIRRLLQERRAIRDELNRRQSESKSIEHNLTFLTD